MVTATQTPRINTFLRKSINIILKKKYYLDINVRLIKCYNLLGTGNDEIAILQRFRILSGSDRASRRSRPDYRISLTWNGTIHLSDLTYSDRRECGFYPVQTNYLIYISICFHWIIYRGSLEGINSKSMGIYLMLRTMLWAILILQQGILTLFMVLPFLGGFMGTLGIRRGEVSTVQGIYNELPNT